MALTSVFGDTDKFDPVIFDTRLNYTIDITESQTKFDSGFFGDNDQFDTTVGGIISVDDVISRTLASTRSLTESESITDSLSRLTTSMQSSFGSFLL